MITKFCLDDFDEATSFWSSAEGVTLNESDSRESIFKFLTRNSDLIFLARSKDGDLTGTVLCGHNGRAGQIYHLAVASNQRGKGLGKAFVQECFKKLKDEKTPLCNIFVYTINEIGNSFWLNTDWQGPKDWRVLQKIV